MRACSLCDGSRAARRCVRFDELDRVREVLMKTGALDDALERATAFSERACRALAPLPPSAERDSLELLARFAVDRSL